MQQPVWDWLVAIYLFLGGLGAGAFLVAAALEFSGIRSRLEFCPTSLVGAALSGPLVGIGALLLVFDLGAGMREPLRIFYMFSNPASVMTWGIWILTLFLPLCFLYGLLELMHIQPGILLWIRKRLRLLIGTGFLGAFTTYSSFAVEINLLTTSDRMGVAAAYAASSLVVGLVSVALGIGAAHTARRRSEGVA